jgi:hypothetical protein
MQIQEFIKSVEEKLKIKLETKPAPADSTMCGIYYDGVYITAAPSGEIKTELDSNYSNERGYPHKPQQYVEDKITLFVKQYTTDPEFKALMNEKF